MDNNDFGLTPIGQTVWEDRYGLRDAEGNLLEKSIIETFQRVAKAIASKEKDSKKWEKKFLDILKKKQFCPGGRILSNAGTHFSQLLNCYVLPFEDDSLEEIMKTASNMAVVQKFGGGCIGGESVVLTNKGPISLKRIVEEKDENVKVLSYNAETSKMEFCNILDRHVTSLPGERVFEVQFDNMRGGVGSKLRASDWHPFFVFDGEKVVEVRADALKPGMAVIGSTDLESSYDEWGWLLGYAAGDAAISPQNDGKNTRIRIVDQNKRNVERASEIMGVECRLSPDNRYQVDVWSCEAYGDVAEKIKQEFGGHQTCFTKHIPVSIWGDSPARRFSFVVGYLDADGHFNKEKKRFEVFTVSKDLAYELMALLGSIGIRSSIRFRPSRKNNESDGWEVRVSASKFVTDCVTKVSSKYSDKEVGAVQGPIGLSSIWKDRLSSSGFNVKTAEAWRGKTEINDANISLAQWLQYGKASRENASTILRACNEDGLASAVLSCQIVRSSKATEEAETLYDLTVDKNQTYVASDPNSGAFVVVHNTGFSYSNLRPEGSRIKGVNGRSCGVLGFIDMMSVISGIIEQGGSRRGANLGLLDVQHPDVWDFISYKNDHNWDKLLSFMEVRDEERWSYFKYQNPYKLQMYNISIGVTDEFMDALKADSTWSFMWKGVEWELYKVRFRRFGQGNTYEDKEFDVMADSDSTAIWKVRRKIPYPTANDIFEVVSKRKVKASEVWGRLCHNAWDDGCPGIINLSTMRKYHNAESTNPILATNPCGEQPLPAYSVCDLGSLILSTFVKIENDIPEVDWSSLKSAVQVSVRFLDNVHDNCDHPLNETKKQALKERRVGLGTMGAHDLLIKMGLDYDSEEGRDFIKNILLFIRDEAYRTSIALAKEKGSFPDFNKNKFKSAYIDSLPEDIKEDIWKSGIRNTTLLSQAPTGTIGTMYSVSTGCEPWFAMSFTRNTRLGSYEDGCPSYIQWKSENPKAEKPSYFKTAQEISPADHLKMLITFSEVIDSATSKTVNLPNSATVDDVSGIFMQAMESGVKGITIFRDGSKEGVFINRDKKKQKEPKPKEEIIEEVKKDFDCEEISDDKRVSPLPRGDRTVGATTRIHLQDHNLYVTVNKNLEGNLVEVFATVGEDKNENGFHTSGVEDSWAEALGKIISLAFRAGVKPLSIIRNLKNIPSDKPVFSTIGDCEHSEPIPSPPHAIARVLEEEMRYVYYKAVKEDLNNKQIRCKSCGSSNVKKVSPICYDCHDCGKSGCAS